MRKFKKDWKTIDSEKINYLMKLGIVQEVMKVEERKAVRREAALIRAEQAEQLRQQQLLREAAGEHTPPRNSQSNNNQNRLNNSDLQNLSVNKSFQQSPNLMQQSKELFYQSGKSSPMKQQRLPSNMARGSSTLVGLQAEQAKQAGH